MKLFSTNFVEDLVLIHLMCILIFCAFRFEHLSEYFYLRSTALFAKALESCDLKALITNVGSGVGAAPAAAAEAAPAAGDAPVAAAKKEEKVEEESDDEDMGFGLFN